MADTEAWHAIDKIADKLLLMQVRNNKLAGGGPYKSPYKNDPRPGYHNQPARSHPPKTSWSKPHKPEKKQSTDSDDEFP